jgi:hypothetical protein
MGEQGVWRIVEKPMQTGYGAKVGTGRGGIGEASRGYLGGYGERESGGVRGQLRSLALACSKVRRICGLSLTRDNSQTRHGAPCQIVIRNFLLLLLKVEGGSADTGNAAAAVSGCEAQH